LVLADPASLELLERLDRIAKSNAPVLVTGETGTGKELAARELHQRSVRAAQPFVAVNAGALPEALIESELFGHERGAFTGAHESKPGWFEVADGGTLFLDEIGDLPLSLQVKLLRVLSTGEITRVGARKPIRVDVRLIAATNVDLHLAMGERRFREDLYYRLSVTRIRLPALRERPGDILPIADYFLRSHAMALGREPMQLTAKAVGALLLHEWPGNVRELENTMHRVAIECAEPHVCERDLGLPELHVGEPLVAPSRAKERALVANPAISGGVDRARVRVAEWAQRDPIGASEAWAALERALANLLPCAPRDLYARVEGELLATAFRYSNHNQLETARLLGLSRHVVRARLLEHGQLRGAQPRRGRASEPVAGLAEPSVLRIGYQYLGMLSWAKASGALESSLRKRNVRISWQQYEGGIQIVDALGRGELDLGVVGDSPAVYAQSQAVPVVYVAAEPPAPRRVALIVPEGSPVRDVRELRGKRVAVNRVAQAHYLLMLALEEAGLGLDDVEVCFEPPPVAQAAFRTSAIDAWAIWDPWLSSARLDLGARVLRDATGLFESSVYYLAHERFARSASGLLAEILTSLQAAASWVASDPQRAASSVAPEFGFSARAIEASLDHEPLSIGVTPHQVAAQQRIADQCLRLRLIPRPVSVASAQWPQLLAG
jgi:aliphatic sulfonates family ABC transporter substrate-binding protein